MEQYGNRWRVSLLEPPLDADVQEYNEADKSAEVDNKKLESIVHATIKKVTDDLRRLSFNTAIAAQMEYVNELYKLKLGGFSENTWQVSARSFSATCAALRATYGS